jgi:hypothetical protein
MTKKIFDNRLKIIIGILLLFLLVYIAPLFFNPILKELNFSAELRLIFSELIFWIQLILLFLYSKKIEKQKFLLWTEKEYSFSYYFVSIILILLTLFIGTVIIAILFKISGINNGLLSDKVQELIQILRNNKKLIVPLAITAAVIEELFFRAYLIPRLQILLHKNYLAIIVSSLLFGIVHFNYGTVLQIIVPFFIGLIFALHYYKFRNIKILILSHFIWDLIAISFKVYINR